MRTNNMAAESGAGLARSLQSGFGALRQSVKVDPRLLAAKHEAQGSAFAVRDEPCLIHDELSEVLFFSFPRTIPGGGGWFQGRPPEALKHGSVIVPLIPDGPRLTAAPNRRRQGLNALSTSAQSGGWKDGKTLTPNTPQIKRTLSSEKAFVKRAARLKTDLLANGLKRPLPRNSSERGDLKTRQAFWLARLPVKSQERLRSRA